MALLEKLVLLVVLVSMEKLVPKVQEELEAPWDIQEEWDLEESLEFQDMGVTKALQGLQGPQDPKEKRVTQAKTVQYLDHLGP